MITGEYLLNIKGVVAKVAFSKSQIYQMVREGSFPQPVANLARWRGADVDSWILEQASQPRTANQQRERGRFAKP